MVGGSWSIARGPLTVNLLHRPRVDGVAVVSAAITTPQMKTFMLNGSSSRWKRNVPSADPLITMPGNTRTGYSAALLISRKRLFAPRR